MSAVALLALLMAQTPDPVGVLRVPRGEVSIVSSGQSPRRAKTADLLYGSDSVQTGASGWAELMFGDRVRLRLSSASQISIDQTDEGMRLRLVRGRVWVQNTDPQTPFELDSSSQTIVVWAESSVVIESSLSAGGSTSTRSGLARVRLEGDAIEVPRGRVLRSSGLRRSKRQAVVGGTALSDLVALEARAGLGDLAGVTAYLVNWVRIAGLGPLDLRFVRQLIEADPEIQGAHYSGAWVEQARRSPPFFEEEVPSRGANVEVEVDFDE